MRPLESGESSLIDLDAVPDDGRRYELVDGLLVVTPIPSLLHQTAVLNLAIQLRKARPEQLKVFLGPLDFRPTVRRSLQPDVLVCRREDIGPRAIERSLVLAVEILSPPTRMTDVLLKRAIYEEAGVDSYWLIDPEQGSLMVLELVDGRYVERAVVEAEEAFDAELPFVVRVVPGELVG
jgi:Uma2 family endonuclease